MVIEQNKHKQVLIIILTSSHICYLHRAVKSVAEQINIKNWKCKLLINVNTLSDSYYNEVLESYSGKLEIVRTESNGLAGKGHNSCLSLFKDRETFDYMIMLDGDDAFFPVAVSQLEKAVESDPTTDVLHVMLNDNVTTHAKENQHTKLIGNFRVYTSLDRQENWWQTIHVDDPYKLPIQICKTPSRLLLASRNIFETTYKIEYSESCRLYDDFLAFMGYVEGQYRGEIKVNAISDPNIYCYNGGNPESVTSLFNDADYHIDQAAFNKETKVFQALQSDWGYLKKLPWLYIEPPQNFTTQQRMVICNDFAHFEMLDRIKHAEEFQIAEDYKHAATCYIGVKEAGVHNELIDLNRGVCLMKAGRKDQAIAVFEGLLASTYERTVDSKIERYTTDNYDANYYLALLYISESNGDPKMLRRAKLHASTCLQKTTSPQMLNIMNIKEPENMIIPLKKATVKKNIIAFYVGFSASFNGENYQSRIVYGSENAVVHVAEELAKNPNNQVFVFCACTPEDETVFNGVTYWNLNKFHGFHNQIHINTMIVSRYIHFFYTFKISADHVIIWVHDAQFHDHFNGYKFPEDGKPFSYNLIQQNNIDSIVCVSEWQRDYLKQWSGMSEWAHHKLRVIGNSIDKSYFDHSLPKVKNRFVYCSDTTRGLDVLLSHWPEIIAKLPDATLDIYFGSISEAQTNVINSLGPSVNFRGKIPQKDLCLELCKAEFWYYPNTSHETFCIVGMQALYAKCIVICRDYSGVAEIVGGYGKRIPGFPTDPEFKKAALDFIFHVSHDPVFKKTIQENAVNAATTWEDVTKKWVSLMNYRYK
jgi:glycosyltransferase involved in cell wall biosynthesis/tetratricopeptide (TPR) repeat protein